MNVLRHDHVADDDEGVALSYLLQDHKEKIAPTRAAQEGLSSIAATGNEMKVPGSVISLQVLPHVRENTGEEVLQM